MLNPLLCGLVGSRNEENCAYSSLTLYWTVILGLFQHLRSRNQMDETRNTRAYAQSVFECSDQPYDPDDPKLHTACSQTCRNHLKDVESKALEDVLAKLVGHIIRSKWFEEARLWGCLCVAVDGREIAYELGEGVDFRVVSYFCWDSAEGRYDGAFAHGMLRRIGAMRMRRYRLAG